MKKTRKYATPFLLLSIFILQSCENILDVKATSELESNYFENENRIERGIGAIYAEIANIYNANMGEGNQFSDGGPLNALWSLPSDELTTNKNNGAQFDAFSALTPGEGTVYQFWKKLYITINRANFMLEKLDDPTVLAVIKTPHYGEYCKGEALFLRAWCNVKLWDYFRQAPNQNKRITSIPDASLKATKDFELLNQSIDDLKKAVDLLPDKWSPVNGAEKYKGRVFKNSARGLLVKCYAMKACYDSQYNGNKNEDYLNAIKYFELIDNGVSTINGVPFGNNFDIRTENNAESLYEYQAGHNQTEDNPWLSNNQGSGSASLGVLWIQYGIHQHTDYMFGGNFGPTTKIINLFLANTGDPRMKETINLGTKSALSPMNQLKSEMKWSNFGGYKFIKYINGDRLGKLDIKYSTTSANNPRLLRLADVKLLAAEAYLQTGNEIAARKQVNDIRKRARISTANGVEALVPVDYSSAITMKEIMLERQLELCGEDDIRWNDLKRWHSAKYVDLSTWTTTDFGYDESKHTSKFVFKADTHTLLPIPTAEISNNINMSGIQNPGYN